MTLLVTMFRLIDALLTLDVMFTTPYGGSGLATHALSFWIYHQGLHYFNVSDAAAASWVRAGEVLAMIAAPDGRILSRLVADADSLMMAERHLRASHAGEWATCAVKVMML